MLWIIGEYVENASEILEAVQEVRKVLGEIPILASEQRLLDEASAEDEPKEKEETSTNGHAHGAATKPKVLADGTYATETAFTSTTTARLEAVKAAAKPPLRSQLFYSDRRWNSAY